MLRARVLLLLLLLLFVHAGVCCVASMVRTYVRYVPDTYVPGISTWYQPAEIYYVRTLCYRYVRYGPPVDAHV